VNRGTVVLLDGHVKGMGKQADCQVLARRLWVYGEETDSLRILTYTDCSVIGAPAELPDGKYLVEFEEYSALAARHKGFWLSFGPPTRVATPDSALAI
jgi:hypothetical protein